MSLLIVLICCTTWLGADESQSFGQNYLKSYPLSVWQAAQSPLAWQSKQWFQAGAIVLSAGALYLTDEDIQGAIQRNRSDLSEAFSSGFKLFGEGELVLPTIGASIVGGYLFDSPKTMDTGLLSLKSFVLSQSVTQTLKLATQRNRPSTDKGKEFWSESGFKRKRDSFPSGHTTIVWSLAPILAKQYQELRWMAPAVYSIATLTSISRVHDNNHWSSDIFVGAVIGYYSAKLTLNSTPRMQVIPNPEKQGIEFMYRF